MLLVTFSVFWLVSWDVTVFGASGLISSVVGYLQVVSGFYIASLAAVATFNQENMDKPMAGKSPVLSVRRRGRMKDEKLTRRRFLCFLFGYLAFLSVLMLFIGIGANLVAPAVSQEIDGDFGFYLKWLFAGCYIFVGYNLIFTTLLGLYYMTDRIHRKDAAFVSNKEAVPKAPETSSDDDF
jgi:hypothetical protein